jgi:hypothetical protein
MWLTILDETTQKWRNNSQAGRIKVMKTYKVTVTVEYTKDVHAENEDDAVRRASHHITSSAEYHSMNTIGSRAELVDDGENDE